MNSIKLYFLRGFMVIPDVDPFGYLLNPVFIILYLVFLNNVFSCQNRNDSVKASHKSRSRVRLNK